MVAVAGCRSHARRRPARAGPAVLGVVLAVVLAASLVSRAAPVAAAGPVPVVYAPPVDGPVLDPFRPPPDRYAAGNRGVDLGTTPGEAVRAAADGVVTFAGRIGADTHVVVLHADGIRTSYAFLAAATVRRGEQVVRGQPVGTAGTSLHFGARAGDEYLDPSLLLGGAEVEVHLVPHGARPPGAAADERRGLLTWLGGRASDVGAAVAGGGLDVAAWLAGGAADAGGALTGSAGEAWAGFLAVAQRRLGLSVPGSLAFGADLLRWAEAQERCTSADQAPPTPGSGRIAVLVAGFGSSSTTSAVQHLDLGALGYEPHRVARFSYAGGRVPGFGHLGGVPRSTYTRLDTFDDIWSSGAELRALLHQIHLHHPGVPVDLIAHSQGGLVVRAALVAGGDDLPPLPDIRTVVTLASPHRGSDLATVGAAIDATDLAGSALRATDDLAGFPVDAPSAGQMAEGSSLLRELRARPLPAGIGVTSIGARWDAVVAGPRTILDGATNVLLPVGGNAHDALPGSDVAQREVALALARRGPTCRPWADLVADAAVATGVSALVDGSGEVLAALARSLDGVAPGRVPPLPGARP